jgi:MerR family copper efflux transcriptional regulator
MADPAAQRPAPSASPLTTGPLADASGVAVSTLRFYERQGLLSPEGRSSGGYRQYSPDSVRRVRFIRRAQELGFTLREVREVLALSDEPERIVLDDVAEQVADKLAELDQRIADLRGVRAALALLVESPVHPTCPVIDAIA